jgi:hypothetical protein
MSVSAADAFQASSGGLGLTICLTIASQAVAYMFESINKPLAEQREDVLCSGLVRRLAELLLGAGFLALALGVRFAASSSFDAGEAALYAALYFGALLLQWFVSEPAQLILKYVLGRAILTWQGGRDGAYDLEMGSSSDSYALMK